MHRIWLYVITIAVEIGLLILTENIISSALITFVIILTGYLAIAFFRNKKRSDLLNEACDPQAFLEATKKQIKITGRNPRLHTLLNIDIGAGLMVMGEYQEAKELLDTIDKSYLSRKNGTYLVYILNLIACSYELGDMDNAEKLFETEIPVLAPVNTKTILAVEILIAERYFYQKKYKESRDMIRKLLKTELSKRNFMDLLYLLAQIEEAEGNMDEAKRRYKKVSEQGGKLWISSQAKKCLEILGG